MPLKYFYTTELNKTISESSLPEDAVLQLKETVHYIATVCRVKVGDPIALVCQKSQCAYRAKIKSINKQAICVQLQSVEAVHNACWPQIMLAAAVIKETHWHWLLQKATELGITEIQPVLSERVMVQVSLQDVEKKRKRWQAVVQSAAEQSESLVLPMVKQPVYFDAFLNNEENLDSVNKTKMHYCFLHERGDNRIPWNQYIQEQFAQKVEHPVRVMLAIGPEGGWSDSEALQFREKGFLPVALGSKILRADTASCVAVSALTLALNQPHCLSIPKP
ncbi:MAG: 16S rRNA (uracil(1498)-N(3))-methyltransferase [Cyanobacteria bacterium P01_H01_bin.74]